MTGQEILSVAQMYRADALAAASGVATTVLMDNAGRAIFEAIRLRWSPRRVAVLCGPGNNGGDGFVVARLLAQAGWPVRLGLLGAPAALKGDAAWAAGGWTGAVEPAAPALLDGAGLIIDALFGAGLSRPLDGMALALVAAIGSHPAPVVAVDVPSGVQGDSGAILGAAAPADLTVTFFRRKPGHYLLPGRALCGEVVVADIGIPAGVLDTILPQQWANGPALWGGDFPVPRLAAHKYARGHAIVDGGARLTGAARLAARAALRVGAGLVTIASPPEAFTIYALSMPTVMVAPVADDAAFGALLADVRKNAVLLGPGRGVSPELRARTLAVLAARKRTVLDADIFASWADAPDALFDALHAHCVLTPHEGEFGRLFGAASSDKLTAARAAAQRAGAVVLLKGADTVIAHPDGRAILNHNAPADLATAGSGDVLSGLILGLLAQGMDAFLAAAAAAWLHGELGRAVGPGLIAEDLAEALPGVLRRLRAELPGSPAR